jgi:dihydroorotate dehydrogenase (NAD+) catalytic subunit
VSGPAIKPMALARCAETVAAVSIPVIGSGGIVSAQDALEFLAVGASAVQIGTVSFVRPAAAIEILRDLAAWLASEGYSKLEDFRGCMALERGACGTAAQGDESEKGAVRAPVEESRS